MRLSFIALPKPVSSIFYGFFLVLSQALTAQAQVDVNVNGAGVALEGYDPVAYFTQGRAVQGRAEFSASHNNVTYHFANSEDKKTFLSDPDKYAPAYGGFCAYGTAHGLKVASDPNEWRIVNGRLYVVANRDFNQRWSTSTPSYIRRADEIWERIKNRRAAELEPIMEP